MIVSHKHRYVFIALPRTASNAIAKELVENYSGEQVLNHHALYRDFLKVASDEEKKYRPIISIRNPIDSVVSSYYKYRTSHHEIYSKPRVTRVGRLRRYVRYFTDTRRYNYVTKNNASFEDYFMRFFRLPYADWSMLDRDKYEYIIRYENIQEDFSAVLQRLCIEQVRPLPMRNKTKKETNNFIQVFQRPETIIRAKEVFGPFMKIWDYKLPEEWATHQESKFNEKIFPIISGGYGLYWKYLR